MSNLNIRNITMYQMTKEQFKGIIKHLNTINKPIEQNISGNCLVLYYNNESILTQMNDIATINGLKVLSRNIMSKDYMNLCIIIPTFITDEV